MTSPARDTFDPSDWRPITARRIDQDDIVRAFLNVDRFVPVLPRPTPPVPTFSIRQRSPPTPPGAYVLVRRSRVNGRWVYTR